jgi:hypothetical protein
VETTDNQGAKLQIKQQWACIWMNEPLKCKQPKKSISDRQDDDTPYEVEEEFYIIKISAILNLFKRSEW